LKVKAALVWVAIVVFLLFLGTQVYQILYPHWFVDCFIPGTGTVVAREFTCFTEYSEVVRFTEDPKGETRTCAVTRIRRCDPKTEPMRLYAQ